MRNTESRYRQGGTLANLRGWVKKQNGTIDLLRRCAREASEVTHEVLASKYDTSSIRPIVDTLMWRKVQDENPAAENRGFPPSRE